MIISSSQDPYLTTSAKTFLQIRQHSHVPGIRMWTDLFMVSPLQLVINMNPDLERLLKPDSASIICPVQTGWSQKRKETLPRRSCPSPPRCSGQRSHSWSHESEQRDSSSPHRSPPTTWKVQARAQVSLQSAVTLTYTLFVFVN